MSEQDTTEPQGFVARAGDDEGIRPRPRTEFLWVNHFDLLPGGDSVKTSHNAVSSGVGGGLSGLVISSTATGDTQPGGNKVVHTAVAVPPSYTVIGVRVGYELTNPRSFISQIRLAQVQDPPKAAIVMLDVGTHHTGMGPAYVDSQGVSIHPGRGRCSCRSS